MRHFTESIQKLYSYILIATAATLWGTMGILAKLAYAHGTNPLTLVALRLTISSLSILFYQLY